MVKWSGDAGVAIKADMGLRQGGDGSKQPLVCLVRWEGFRCSTRDAAVCKIRGEGVLGVRDTRSMIKSPSSRYMSCKYKNSCPVEWFYSKSN